MSKFSFGFSFNREIMGFVKWAARQSNSTDEQSRNDSYAEMDHTHQLNITALTWNQKQKNKNLAKKLIYMHIGRTREVPDDTRSQNVTLKRTLLLSEPSVLTQFGA